ncbi:uncharacterized protein LOC123868195 isoform X2 [Maniola jurtina]|uniref:uncharacterized protein LOC123868195 isoform X2 n=1 Tax=Maniola jurtina TaxID=191418 RepID=UPI001E688CB2|nr:uncharacterized protein LOC123868195 isoform X2 [Maniola jurtina]
MDIFEVIGILEALKEDKEKHWVHPLNKKRLSIGQFHVLYPELRKYPEKFYQYFNMTSHTFDELLNSITQYIAKNNITRDTISPEERLTITLSLRQTDSLRPANKHIAVADCNRFCCESATTAHVTLQTA